MNAVLLSTDSLGGSRSGFLHAGLQPASSRGSLGSGGPVSGGHLCAITQHHGERPGPGPKLSSSAAPVPNPGHRRSAESAAPLLGGDFIGGQGLLFREFIFS